MIFGRCLTKNYWIFNCGSCYWLLFSALSVCLVVIVEQYFFVKISKKVHLIIYMHKHVHLHMQFVVKMYLSTLPVEYFYFYWIIPASPHAESAVKNMSLLLRFVYQWKIYTVIQWYTNTRSFITHLHVLYAIKLAIIWFKLVHIRVYSAMSCVTVWHSVFRTVF